MKYIKLAAFILLFTCAPFGYANVVVTGVSLAPNPIGVSDSTTITVTGYVNTVAPGQPNCTGVEIFFGDSTTPSTNPYKPAGTYARILPSSSGSFPISVNHQYSQAGTYYVIVSRVNLYNGVWYQCGGSTGVMGTLEVLGDTIRSVKSITPAVVNQQTSVVVKGFGSCSQNVQVNWGDNNTSSIAGPVNLKTGGVASHTYASAGTFTVTASGSVCDGSATTTIKVGLFNKPGPVLDLGAIQNLRDRLDRFAQLPGLPIPGDGPACPMCAGLEQQVKMLDQTGHELQMQAEVILKDLSAYRGKAKVQAKGSVAGDMVKQFDEYFGLRAQLMKLHSQALERSHGAKAMPKK